MAGTILEQYMSIKEKQKGAVLFFQVGGFYQLYFYDAEIAEKELGMTLTIRSVGGGKQAPMCGFPVSGEEKYAKLLNAKGYHVVICKQMPEKDAQGKCVRKVVAVKTPETGIETADFSQAWENYLKTYTYDAKNFPKKEQKIRKNTENDCKNELWKALACLDLNWMTPMEALVLMGEWKKKYVSDQNESDRL